MNERQRAFEERRVVDSKKKSAKASKRSTHPLFKEKCDAELACRCCGRQRRGRRMERHHIVHRSMLMGTEWTTRDDPDNGMALCDRCHTQHHQNRDVFHRGMLSESEVAFILRHAGEGWLDKHYPTRAS